jgi:hypothetical protein
MTLRLGVSVSVAALVGGVGLQGCSGTTESDGNHSPATGGRTSANSRAKGGTSTNPATGGTQSSSTAELGNAFGEVGAATPVPTYVRSTLPAPSETATSCQTTLLTGTIQGIAVNQLYAPASYGWTGVQGWSFEDVLGSDGMVMLLGTSSNTLTLDATPVGTVVSATGAILELPSSVPQAQFTVCANGTRSMERAANHVIIRLEGLSTLPACDTGTSVLGQVDLALAQNGKPSLTGTIEGASFAGEDLSISQSATRLAGVFGNWRIRTRFVATSSTTATLADAWLTDTATGNVYCAGADSAAEASVVVDYFGDPTYLRQLHFRSLKRPGNCTAISGIDSIEVRSCILSSVP